jgi:hypothetical protein
VDEDVSTAGGDGSAVGPVATWPDPPTARTLPPLPERARYRPLRGLDELLDDFLGGPAASS